MTITKQMVSVSNKTSINIAGVILIILILVGLVIVLRNRSFDNFIVFLDDVAIPKTCWDYLVTNGHDFFLFNSRVLIDSVNNPLKFPTKQAALAYLKQAGCQADIPFVDLVMRKKIEDPTVSLQRECNRIISPKLFDLDICSTYGSDNDTLTSKYLARVNKIESDKKLYANYDLEACMINKAVSRDKELDDSGFKAEFAQYFDRMNSQIPEEYLYITG
jgi:hypothetical protein